VTVRGQEAQEVAQVLLRLGDHEDEVAASLLAEGIKGRMVASNRCPISNFIRSRAFGDLPGRYVSSNTHSILVSVARAVDGLVLTDEYTLQPPTPVARFISKFDSGLYPELIEDE
jgi:hypothetical protein